MLQLYFEKITELTVGRSSSILFKKALVSLATDSGLHPLVPYFTYFIADEVNMILFYLKFSLVDALFGLMIFSIMQVSRNLSNFSLLFALMRLAWSLLQNPHIHIEPYVRISFIFIL